MSDPKTAGAFGPLRHGTFAMLWTSALLSNIGGWMHDVAAGWLMTTLVPSPDWVAMVQAATTLPVCLLALPAGTLADRMDRRTLLMVAQGSALLLALLLGTLVVLGTVTPHTLLLITFGIGVCTAVTSPAWQAILPALVPRSDLPAAIALHAVGMNIARAIGPAVGGVLIVALGIAWPFFVNALSFVAILAALWWWKAPPAVHRANPTSFGRSLLEGLAQAHGNAALRNTLLRSVLFYAFGACYWALLPLVARELLGGTARLYGVLVGCIGVGAVLCALVLPKLRARLGLDGTVIVGTVSTAAAMLLYGTVHAPVLGAVASLIAGAAWIAALSSLNVAAQLAVPDAMRARGMALYTAVFYGCLAVGSLVWGHVATAIGVDTALRIAAGGAVLVLMATRFLPLDRAPAIAQRP